MLDNELLNIFSVHTKVLEGGKEGVIKNNYLLALPPGTILSEMAPWFLREI